MKKTTFLAAVQIAIAILALALASAASPSMDSSNAKMKMAQVAAANQLAAGQTTVKFNARIAQQNASLLRQAVAQMTQKFAPTPATKSHFTNLVAMVANPFTVKKTAATVAATDKTQIAQSDQVANNTLRRSSSRNVPAVARSGSMSRTMTQASLYHPGSITQAHMKVAVCLGNVRMSTIS